MDRQTYRRTNKWMDRQTDTDGWTDGQTDIILTDGEVEIHQQEDVGHQEVGVLREELLSW